jgi:hypothetical protein
MADERYEPIRPPIQGAFERHLEELGEVPHLEDFLRDAEREALQRHREAERERRAAARRERAQAAADRRRARGENPDANDAEVAEEAAERADRRRVMDVAARRLRIATQVRREHPTWTQEQRAAEVERRLEVAQQ